MLPSSQTSQVYAPNQASIDSFRAFPVHLNSEVGRMPILTKHAAKRAGQRNISMAAINAALDYGTMTYRTGAVFTILLKKDVKKAKKPGLKKYVGTTVLSSNEENVIITVYRNPDAISKIKKLPKRDYKKI